MYEGRTTMETGRILGHENLGIVAETGEGVERVKVGDRVCLPFNVGGGFCDNCETKQGKLPFAFGELWFKGQRIGTGQANVKAYNRRLAELIHRDRAKPSFVVSHELPLDGGAEAYRNFDDRADGWTKVVLKP